MTESIKGIIAQLEHQKASIDRALAALREVEGIESPAPVAHKETAVKKKAAPIAKKVGPGKGTLTPEGRQKLADAMKRRWAVKHANSKKAAAKKKA